MLAAVHPRTQSSPASADDDKFVLWRAAGVGGVGGQGGGRGEEGGGWGVSSTIRSSFSSSVKHNRAQKHSSRPRDHINPDLFMANFCSAAATC